MHTTKPHFTPSYSSRSPGEFTGEKSAMRTVAFWLSLILIFVIPWENVVTLKGLGTVSRATGLLVAAFWVLTVVRTGRFRKPHPFHMMVYLFLLWNVVSVFWSVDVASTVIKLLTYFQLAVLVWILWDLYTTPAALKAGLQAYILGAYVSIGSLLANYLRGKARGYFRYAATGFDPNDLGVILTLGIPVAWHLALSGGNSKKTHLLRLVNYAYVPAAILAILLTASRGTLVATVPAFLFVIGSLARLKLFSRVLICTVLVGALFVLQPLVPQSSFQRLGTTGTQIAEGDLSGRVSRWREGLVVFGEHPLLGSGSGAFRAATESGHSAHNSFLNVLVELGTIGFVLFVFILAVAVYQTIHQSRWDSRLWLTILSVWAIGSLSLAWDQRKQTWLFLSLAVVGAGLSVECDESRLRSKFLSQMDRLYKVSASQDSQGPAWRKPK